MAARLNGGVSVRPAPISLTEKQDRFVDAIVNTACGPKAAAKAAGYSGDNLETVGGIMIRQTNIQYEIRRRREILLSTDLAPLALSVLGDVLRDKEIKPDVRVRAALGVLDHTRRLDESAPSASKNPSEMSVAELEALVSKATSRLIDVTPIVTDSGTVPNAEKPNDIIE